MLWLVELCPALLPPVAVHSPPHLLRQITTWNVLAIQIGQLFETLQRTALTGDGGRGHPGIGTCVCSSLHLHAANMQQVLDSEPPALEVVLQNIRLVGISKDTIQRSGEKLGV